MINFGSRILLVFLILFILEFFAVLSLNSAAGQKIFMALPARLQSAYINYVLEADFGYFRNCARKRLVFDVIKASRRDAMQVDFDISLLVSYFLEGGPKGSGDCPFLTEPGPVLSKRFFVTAATNDQIREFLRSATDRQKDEICEAVERWQGPERMSSVGCARR